MTEQKAAVGRSDLTTEPAVNQTPVENSNNATEPPPVEEQLSLLAEFGIFLRENKIWWITPIVLALLLIAAVAYLSKAAESPFIYPLF